MCEFDNKPASQPVSRQNNVSVCSKWVWKITGVGNDLLFAHHIGAQEAE
jgi:hypothetical protein